MTGEDLNREFLLHKEAAYRYAASILHDPHLAQDATQDLYEKLWRRRIFIREKGFRQLMMTAMRNICIDQLRANNRYQAAEPQEQGVDAFVENDVRELAERAKQIIATLPLREREVLHLRDCEGMEFRDIVEIVDISEAAARMACSRARQKVKEELVKIINYGL